MHILEHGAQKCMYGVHGHAERIAVVDLALERTFQGMALPRCRVSQIQIEVRMTNGFVRPQLCIWGRELIGAESSVLASSH
jgi:hypothetical protein